MALNVSVVTGDLGLAGGGVATAVNGLYSELQRHSGVAVTVHCIAGGEIGDSRVRTKRHSTIGPARFGFSLQLSRDLAEAKPDVVHVHGLWSYRSIAAAAWQRSQSRPVVFSAHGMVDSWALNFRAIRKKFGLAFFERGNLRAADCLHALNAAEAESMRALGLRNPVAVIPNGVDLPARAVREVRGRTRHLLFLGRFHPKKGLEPFLRAWALLASERPDVAERWVVDIAGWDDGGHLQKLRRLVRELSLQERVNFHGPVFGADKQLLLRNAHAFMLPSLSEGLPMAVLEAWAFGLPVLMTRACNLPIGFAMKAAVEISSEPAMMVKQLAAVLDDEASLAVIGRNGRELVEKEFNWSSAASKMLGLYEWLANGHAKPAFVES
jgi:poly(glycerol-phosphate) alpha-glucosyltransferase